MACLLLLLHLPLALVWEQHSCVRVGLLEPIQR